MMLSHLRQTSSWLLLLALFATSDAPAQGFLIDGTSPAPGATDVPLRDTIRFEFNDAVAQSSDLNTAVLALPRRALQVNGVALIPDEPERDCASLPSGQVCPSVIEYMVTHQEDTDYTWIAYAVTTPKSKRMAEPFVLRYTTAAQIGEHVVSGQIGGVQAKRTGAVSPPLTRATLARIADLAHQVGLGTPSYEAAAASAIAASPTTLVFLVEHFSSVEAAWQVKAATAVAGQTGPFEVDYIRDGTYWPIAVRFSDPQRRAIEAFGFYDADGDGAADPVEVAGSDVSGILIQMRAFPLVPSKTYLQAARDSADAFGADYALLGIQAAQGARPAGTAYAWTYRFFYPDNLTQTVVYTDPLRTIVNRENAPAHYKSFTPIPDDYVESNAALDLVLEAGGDAFLEGVRPENTSTTVEAGAAYVHPPFVQGENLEPYWHVRLGVTTSTSSSTFDGFVNMLDQSVTTTDAEAVSAAPSAATALLPPFPNPAAGSFHLTLDLQHATTASVDVYDLLGRRVTAVAEDVPLAQGRHRWTIDTQRWPPGLYVVRLRAGTTVVASRTVAVL